MQTWHLEQLKTESSLPAEAGIGLWLPSETCSIHVIDKPSAPRRKWPVLLPWLIEERLLDNPENMHFTVLDTSDDKLHVLATTRAGLETGLAFAEKVGVKVATIQPDFLALPWQADEVTLAWRLSDNGRVLVVRTGAVSGFAAPEGLAASLLQQYLAGEARVRALMPEEALPAFLHNHDVVTDEAPDWHAAAVPGINLLHGEYAPATDGQTGGKPRMVAAALFALCCVLLSGWLAVSNAGLRDETVMLEESSQQYFSQAFPGIRLQDNDVRSSIEAVQADRFLQREKLQEPLPAILLALDPVLTGCNCRLNALNANEGSATLEFSGEVVASLFDQAAGLSASTSTDEAGNTTVVLGRSVQ